jgi:ABC-type transport system substrate-binding protein
MNPEVGATLKVELMQIIEKVEVVDDNTVKIVLKAPSSTLMDALAVAYCKIVSKKFVEGGGNVNKTLTRTSRNQTGLKV